MEVYILDSLYRRAFVVDRFESLIWTERWQEVGDFELVLPSTTVNRALFRTDMPLGLNESRRVMLVETVEDSTSQEGVSKLTVKGRSIEKIFADRVARNNKNNTKTTPKWSITGTPWSIANQIFVSGTGAISAADAIPLYASGNAYPSGTIPFPTDTYTWDQEPDTVLQALTDLCSVFDFGFRLYRVGDTGTVYFNLYTGYDRTTQQTVLAPVIFSPGLETVQSTTALDTVENAKNVAYVVSEQGFEIVYAPGVPSSVSGLNRRVLLVKADSLKLDDGNGNDVTPTAAQITAYLKQYGLDELAKNRPFKGIDGEINEHSPYRYEVDYYLGDLVEMRNTDGVTNHMRVTEHIFVHDEEGERSYPTLSIQEYLTPATWDSWIGLTAWADMGATEYWNTQA